MKEWKVSAMIIGGRYHQHDLQKAVQRKRVMIYSDADIAVCFSGKKFSGYYVSSIVQKH